MTAASIAGAAEAAGSDAPVALVTGASRGIGRAISTTLARQGYRIVANWLRAREPAESLARELESAGSSCTLVQANVGSARGIETLVRAAQQVGRLDVVVHSAALGAFKPLLETRRNQWSLTMEINALALLDLARGLGDLLAASRGVMLAISSHGGRRAIPNYGAVGVSKAALEAQTRYLAAELGPRGVRVNAVCAGWVDTDAVRRFPGRELVRRELAVRIPLRRLAEPADVADAVSLLVRPEARWITGQVIVVDGGESLL